MSLAPPAPRFRFSFMTWAHRVPCTPDPPRTACLSGGVLHLPSRPGQDWLYAGRSCQPKPSALPSTTPAQTKQGTGQHPPGYCPVPGWVLASTQWGTGQYLPGYWPVPRWVLASTQRGTGQVPSWVLAYAGTGQYWPVPGQVLASSPRYWPVPARPGQYPPRYWPVPAEVLPSTRLGTGQYPVGYWPVPSWVLAST